MQNGISQIAPTPWPPVVERRPRVWPGVLLVLLYWAVLKVPGWLFPGTKAHVMVLMFGSMVVPALFVLWWLFFSRVTWRERLFGLLACAGVGGAMWMAYDPSLRDNVFFAACFMILPVVFSGWVVWLFLARSSSRQARLAGLCVVCLLTFGYFTSQRFDGMTGEFGPEFSYRWTPTAEDRYVAARGADKVTATADASNGPALGLTSADWPGFRGPARDGRRLGVRIATDWSQRKPKEVWRRQIGPGWGSFAAVGSRVYTQEQFGTSERVVCLDANTGKDVWVHQDQTRHKDNESGPGPRATPTFHEGRIYALGGTGRLNCLDAATGKPIWSRDIIKDSDAEQLHWGFSGSPLVEKGIVTVFAGGPDGKGVLGYHADSGELAWAMGKCTGSYCSTQPAKVAGADQIVLTTAQGLTAFDPIKGDVVWQYDWDFSEEYGKDFNRVTQPAQVSDTDFLIGTSFGNGLRRVHVGRDGSNWKSDQVWESKAISPYYNDLVVHKGHLYGIQAPFLICADLESGKSAWKERGYGAGQILLLADQDLLLVLAENGDVALVEAKPESRKEIARFHAIEGKTWNHPVIARGRLYVRNAQEAACFELATDGAVVAANDR
jgi:outer membrane protein assembly factor BamB